MIHSQRGRPNIPRAVAMYVASRSAGFSHPAICQVFGVRRPSAVSQACQRARAALTQDVVLQAAVSEFLPGTTLRN